MAHGTSITLSASEERECARRITVIATAGNANSLMRSLPRSYAASSVSYPIEGSLGLYTLARRHDAVALLAASLDTSRRLIAPENPLRLRVASAWVLVARCSY